MELQSGSFGVLSTSYPCHPNGRRCHPLKTSVRRNVPFSCTSCTVNRRTNTCRPWAPLHLHRNGVRIFKCKSAANEDLNTPIDVAATERLVVGDEDGDYPLWMEEDDPNWPEDDPNGEGVGFQVDNFFNFQPKIVNEPNEDGSVDEDDTDLNWEAEQYQWIVREITSAEWDLVAREDPTPLIFFAFERYGPRSVLNLRLHCKE